VEVVKAFFAAWNAGDMDAVRELYDPEVVMRAAEGWPEPGPFVGREAVMRQHEQQRAASIPTRSNRLSSSMQATESSCEPSGALQAVVLT
jgi:ketosteroid isomerase-like protein